MTTLRNTRLQRRLLPLQAGTLTGGLLLWPATEKLFMGVIGFNATQIGIMAAAYAMVTPIVEIPSGILADRWSRKGLLMLAYAALLAATLTGGLSTGVVSYITSMLFFSIFFALHSGTSEAVLYDMVLEETGDSERYEATSGRLRALSSTALLAGALVGGWLAAATSPRTTFFAPCPCSPCPWPSWPRSGSRSCITPSSIPPSGSRLPPHIGPCCAPSGSCPWQAT